MSKNNSLSRLTKNLCYPAFFLSFLTVISQDPYLVTRGLTQLISFPAWILIGCYYLPQFKLSNKQFSMTLLWAVVILFCVLGQIFIEQDYIGTRFFYSFNISFFVYIIGICFGRAFDKTILLKSIALGFFLACCIVAFSLVVTVILGKSLFTSSVYVYGSKNSISQILLTGLLFNLIVLNKFYPKIIFYSLNIFLITIMLILQSRATIIALPFLLLWFIISSNTTKLQKKKASLLVITFIVFLFFSSIFSDTLQTIIFAGRDTNNLEDISSGRLSQLLYFIDNFHEVFLFGDGKIKFESFFLSVLYQYGLPISILIFSFTFKPLLWCLHNYKKEVLTTVLLLICYTYLLNGVFEELSPYGPGTKCFALWFLFGIASTKTKKTII